MELIQALQQIMQKNMQAMQLTNLVIGTVTAESPLEITSSTAMAPLRAGVLYLTEPVIEKKIPILQHTHTTPDGATGSALESVVCQEDGKPLPVEGGYIILNRKLEVGDKVLMLRVQNGQKFIVLSRIFES